MVLDIMKDIEEFFEGIKEFFLKNSSNPFLWVGIIVIALILFEIIFQSLRKE